MRTIRVKESNQCAVIAGLIEAGFTAEPTEAPLAEWEWEENSFNEFEERTHISLLGMTGILTSASGHQAHKVISALKKQGVIN